MADRMKDAEDRILEALLSADPIADDGFSDRIVGKIRRRLWVQRLTLPVAVVVGAAVSIKPLSMLVSMLIDMIRLLPNEIFVASTSWIPPLPTIVLGGILFGVFMFALQMFEE